AHAQTQYRDLDHEAPVRTRDAFVTPRGAREATVRFETRLADGRATLLGGWTGQIGILSNTALGVSFQRVLAGPHGPDGDALWGMSLERTIMAERASGFFPFALEVHGSLESSNERSGAPIAEVGVAITTTLGIHRISYNVSFRPGNEHLNGVSGETGDAS